MFLPTFSDVNVVPCFFKYSLVRDFVCTSCIELYSTKYHVLVVTGVFTGIKLKVSVNRY